MSTRLQVLIIAAPGLEPIVRDEAVRLVGGSWRTSPGGVEGWTDLAGLALLAGWHRTGDGIRVRIGRFEARTFDALVDGSARVPWHAWLPPGCAVQVRVRCAKSRLYHSGAVAQRIAEVLASAGHPSSDDGVRVHVRLHQDRAVVRVDALGAEMHQRGYRTRVGRAPLRESLAAACVDAARGDLETADVVVDPFVGSGTLLAEVSLAMSGSRLREGPFAFTSWPSVGAIECAPATTPAPAPCPSLVGTDRSEHELENARENLGRLGVRATLKRSDVGEVAWPPGAVVVANPPWGTRSGRDDARATLRRFGDHLRAASSVRAAWVLLPADGQLARATGLSWHTRLAFDDRGRRVTWSRWAP